MSELGVKDDDLTPTADRPNIAEIRRSLGARPKRKR